MGAFGGELWNVLEVDPGLPMPMSDVRMRLGEILASAGRSPLPGVIVYLPPRDYRIDAQAPIRRVLGDAWDDPDLLIPPKVLLWFAPNARLIIGPNAVVRFDGSLRADPRQIFLLSLIHI